MRIRRSFLLAAGLTVALGLLAPVTSNAQGPGVVVTPYAGFFSPATKVADPIKQANALALGLNASWWLNDRFAVEVGGAWAFSDAKASASAPGFALPGTVSSRVLMGSAKLMVNLIPFTENSALRLGVGPAIINRGGDAFTSVSNGEYRDLTDYGAAISLCSRIPLTNLLSVRLRAEDYVYQSQLRFVHDDASADRLFDKKTQNDLIFSAGLQFAFWR